MGTPNTSGTTGTAGTAGSTGIRVVLGEVNHLHAECLSLALSLQGPVRVAAWACSTSELLQLTQSFAPEVVVVAAGLPGTHGVRTVRQLRSACPTVKVMVTLGQGYEGLIHWALRAGADGVFSMQESVSELMTGIQRLADRGTYLSPQMALRVFRSLRGEEPVQGHDQLSKREFEIMRLLFEGQRMTDIASTLHISIKTASTHKAHLFEKLGLSTLKDLYQYVAEHELFPLTHVSRVQ